MLRLRTTSALGANSIPRRLTTLSVSWLNDQFKAVAVHRGVLEATWDRPGVTDGPGRFADFIREAVQETGYRGQTVSLVLAHPRLVQQLVDVPPVQGAVLSRVLQRQAQQQKLFDGEAAWASQTSPSGKGGQRVVLHLFPRLLLDQLIQGCKRNDLHLTAVLPPSAVLHHQLTQLPLAKDEVALLAAETGESTTLVIGRSDGQILLARALPGNWNEQPERLAVDLNRTILFVNQQYGVTANQGVWLFGPGAAEHAPAVQGHLQFPVKVSPVDYEPFYWATQALKLRPELTPNLIEPLLQKAPQRRVFAKVVLAGTALVVAASLAASAYFLRQSAQAKADVKTLSAQLARLQAKQNELQRLDHELSRKKQVVQLITGDRPPPTPAWLFAYLAEAVPPDLVVTNLQIKREESHYRVRLAGTVQPALKQPASPPASLSLSRLKARLSDGPFYLKILEPVDKAKPAAAPPPPSGPGSSVPDWLSHVASLVTGKPAPVKAPAEDPFVVEGVMQ